MQPNRNILRIPVILFNAVSVVMAKYSLRYADDELKQGMWTTQGEKITPINCNTEVSFSLVFEMNQKEFSLKAAVAGRGIFKDLQKTGIFIGETIIEQTESDRVKVTAIYKQIIVGAE